MRSPAQLFLILDGLAQFGAIDSQELYVGASDPSEGIASKD